MKWILSKAGKQSEWDDGNGEVIDTTAVVAHAVKSGSVIVGNVPTPPKPLPVDEPDEGSGE